MGNKRRERGGGRFRGKTEGWDYILDPSHPTLSLPVNARAPNLGEASAIPCPRSTSRRILCYEGLLGVLSRRYFAHIREDTGVVVVVAFLKLDSKFLSWGTN